MQRNMINNKITMLIGLLIVLTVSFLMLMAIDKGSRVIIAEIMTPLRTEYKETPLIIEGTEVSEIDVGTIYGLSRDEAYALLGIPDIDMTECANLQIQGWHVSDRGF